MLMKRSFRLGLRREGQKPFELQDPPQIVIQRKNNSTAILARVASLEKGTCHGGKSASLIVLEFTFHTLIRKTRFTKITVKVGLEAETPTCQPPTVHHFCPGILDSSSTEVNVAKESGLELKAGFRTLGINRSHKKRTEYTKGTMQRSRGRDGRTSRPPANAMEPCKSMTRLNGRCRRIRSRKLVLHTSSKLRSYSSMTARNTLS